MKGYTIENNIILVTLDNDKIVKIGKAWADKCIKNLDTNMEDVILMYLEDNGYIVNQEQDELDKQAKGVIKLVATKEVSKKKTQKERTQKENPTKETIIQTIVNALQNLDVENLTIENKAKLVTFTLDNKDFKIDLVEKRKPKVK